MTALKRELMEYIVDIPDEKLAALKPLLHMLMEDTVSLEKVDFDDLTEDEKESVIQAELEYTRGETIKHEDIDWS